MAWYNPFSWFKEIDPFIYKNGQFNGNYFMPFNSGDYFFGLSCEKDYQRAYIECAPLKSIIKRRAVAFGNGIIEVVKTTPSQNYVKDPEIINLINNPNPIQTQRQFFAQQNTYIDIHGYCPVFKITSELTGGVVTSMWNIPPWLFDIEYTGKWLKQKSVDGIFKNAKLAWYDGEIDLPMSNLFFVCDEGIGTEDDTGLLLPHSRLQGLEYNISNLIGANKSLNTIISKRGAVGILSNGAQDNIGQLALKESDKTELQRDFAKYGLTGQPFQMIITNANLKWQNMTVPVKDLQLHEGKQEDIKEIARAYGYPSELLSLTDVPYLNRKYCKKELYSDTIIPEGNSRMEQFSAGIIPKDQKIKIQYNFDNIDVLQEEKLQQYQSEQQLNLVCQTQFNAGIITLNDWKKRLGQDVIQDDNFNKYKEVQLTLQNTANGTA